MILVGTPALVPLGIGAWLHGGLAHEKRELLFSGATTIACVADLALWSAPSFMYAPGLRLQVSAAAFLVAATAASLAIGAAAAFLWTRGWPARGLALAAVAAFICVVGFEIAVLTVWAAEL